MVRGKIRKLEDRPVVKTPPINASIHNRFDIEVMDAQTGKVRQRAQGLNTICDQLWARMCSPAAYFGYIHYGTGSGSPSPSDTSLFSYYGGGAVESSKGITVDYETGIAYVKRSIQLTASTAVGATITEVGIAYGSGSNTLCTHAMLKDMNGNSISITKTDMDVINIYATVYIHFGALGFDKGHIRLHNNYYTNDNSKYTLLQFLGGVTDTLMTSAFFGTTVQLSTCSAGGYRPSQGSSYVKTVAYTYDKTGKKITGTVARVESSEFNIGGIREIMIGCKENTWTGYQIGGLALSFRVGGDWFPYTEIVNEAVGTGDGSTVDFALDFPFAHDAKIYIDGVETTNFTLDYGPHDTCPYGYVDWITSYSRPGNHIPYDWAPNDAFTGDRYFYNSAWKIGLSTLYIGKDVTLYASNDMMDWVTVREASASDTSSAVIPEAYRNYKYWKATARTESRFMYSASYNTFNTVFSDKKLHFSTPPAYGAAITADYKTDTIAKDADHVFDISFEIQLGEYNED